MKIVLAPDKFKGSLTAIEFCYLVAAGIREKIPEAQIISLPLADGGDGTIDILNFYLKGDFLSAQVHDPLFRTITARYLYSENSETAFIEMAEASGHKLLKPSEKNCKNATTLGTGELIMDAVSKGAKKIILGIGGSATNDCGMGMATALGYQFLNSLGESVSPIGANLSEVAAIDVAEVDERLKNIEFFLACDVSNPLYGMNGAAHVYAQQKGATPEDIVLLDQGLKDFASVLENHFGINPQEVPGAGAAGGMGIGSMLFLSAHLVPGIDMIKKLANFDSEIENADWIITGEGQLDEQTLSGKTINGVIQSGQEQGIPVASFCGNITLSPSEIRNMGIQYSDAIMKRAVNIRDAMENSEMYLKEMAVDFTNWLLKEA
ncbi:glycerate kinase [Aureisphaera galaxeae]|uniref:glycerate kinase n=1 Tax=Aureisphaera galaxeae TaxID=1538023 RepID=UPI002350BC17|nr:glycerate kinase [Aureisphaera galaxeae]MDC8004611.1 glycerate kinase [Aureisphaera galaxeae]